MEWGCEMTDKDLNAAIEWGQWNIGPKANRLHAARLAAMSPARRRLHRIAGVALDLAILGASWAFWAALAGSLIYG